VSTISRSFALPTNEGTSETALSPDQLKDATVGALEIQQETGNVVLDHQGENLYQEESRILSCACVALSELPAKDTRYRGQNGGWEFAYTGGGAMGAVDIKVGAGYSLEKIDEQDVKTYMMLKSLPPEDRRAVAALNHADPSIVAMIEKAEAEAAQRMQGEMQQAQMQQAQAQWQQFTRGGGTPQGAAAGPSPQMNGVGNG